MEILIVLKGAVEDLPPVMNVARLAAHIGVPVRIVASSCAESVATIFERENIELTVIQEERDVSRTRIGKLFYWREFRAQVERILKSEQDKRCVLWVASGDTAMAIGGILRNYSYVLQLHEIYDQNVVYKNALKRYARNALAVVVPEVCRAGIVQAWYGLSRMPFVLPNKSFDHPRLARASIADPSARSIIDAVGGCKLVLFQGRLHLDRDVRAVARAVSGLGREWRFVVMGPDCAGYLAQLMADCPSAIHIPNVVAPGHLDITSHATIGVITYSCDSLNHVFCAPNKVWEYSGFGLPMLCNDLPALRLSVANSGAGECCDFRDEEVIANALVRIESEYDSYKAASAMFFESVNMPGLLKKILVFVENRVA